MSLFSEKVHQNDSEDTDHFENIQSTNWYLTIIFMQDMPTSLGTNLFTLKNLLSREIRI